VLYKRQKIPKTPKTYATSSCSIRTKKSAKHSPGNTNVTIGVNIDGKKDAVIIFFYNLEYEICN
jgi:hypothetical protein